MAVLKQKCPKGHSQSWSCYSGAAPVACQKCEKEIKDAQKKLRKALNDQQRRDESIQKHLKEVAKVQEEIDQITQGMNDARLNADQAIILAQKRKDLANIKELASKASLTPQQGATNMNITDEQRHKQVTKATEPSNAPNPALDRNSKLQKHLKICLNHNSSSSKTEWQRQKNIENASNPAIDEIMEMIGLEAVKSQVLRIKSKVETSIRQGTDLKKERLGLVLLGNPGTGRLFN